MTQEEIALLYKAVSEAYFSLPVEPDTIEDRVFLKRWAATLYTQLGRECASEFVYGR